MKEALASFSAKSQKDEYFILLRSCRLSERDQLRAPHWTKSKSLAGCWEEVRALEARLQITETWAESSDEWKLYEARNKAVDIREALAKAYRLVCCGKHLDALFNPNPSLLMLVFINRSC